MKKCNNESLVASKPNRQLLGCFNYVASISTPDIAFVTDFLNQFKICLPMKLIRVKVK